MCSIIARKTDSPGSGPATSNFKSESLCVPNSTWQPDLSTLSKNCLLHHFFAVLSDFSVIKKSDQQYMCCNVYVYICCFCASIGRRIVLCELTMLTTTTDAFISLFRLTRGTLAARIWCNSKFQIATSELNATRNMMWALRFETGTQTERTDNLQPPRPLHTFFSLLCRVL